ncbi:gltB, partial [Symbiodinium pilosum]
AAAGLAATQGKQTTIYPLVFAAAVGFEDGAICSAAELKGIEYGCTVDAVSLLLPELVRARKEGQPPPAAIVQVDNYGLAHAPFAAARSLLIEHGFGDVLLIAHSDEAKWTEPLPAKEALPHANFLAIF